MHSKYKQSGLQSNYLEFSRLRAKCKRLSDKCYGNYINYTENNIIDNSKLICIILMLNVKLIIFVISCDNLEFKIGPAIAICRFFSSIYCDTHPHCDLSDQLSGNNVNISSISIKISDIYNMLSTLDYSGGSGPDRLPLLRHCGFVLARPLFHIFNLSLSIFALCREVQFCCTNS